jgi:mannose-6-phosphate isomerase
LTRPTRLNATFYEKIWGSTNLEPWFPNSEKKIGEVWFTAEPPLPILVKFLFTSGKLSVQVHPAGPRPQGKTEMWYILRAAPGARIALGFREPVSRERLRDAARSGEIESLLAWFAVKAGETYFTPARTVHAIGAGIALCEIQQNSDVTYRLYDYGRPRELHLEQAAAVADLGRHPGASAAIECSPGHVLLARCEYFETELLTTPPRDDAGSTHLLVFLEGRGTIDGTPFQAGEVWLAPEGPDRLEIQPKPPFRALRVREPH